MLTEVVLTCNFHLGGYIQTDFLMRSVSAAILTVPEYSSLQWLRNHWSDVTFVLLAFGRVAWEFYIIWRAARFDRKAGAQDAKYTSFFPETWRERLAAAAAVCGCDAASELLKRSTSDSDDGGELVRVRSSGKVTHRKIFATEAGKEHNTFKKHKTFKHMPLQQKVVTAIGLRKTMRKLHVTMSDHQIRMAMASKYASHRSIDGQPAMNENEFHDFYVHYCRRAYLLHAISVATSASGMGALMG